MFVVVGGRKNNMFPSKDNGNFLCALMNLFKIIIIKSYILFGTESNCKLYFFFVFILCLFLYKCVLDVETN